MPRNLDYILKKVCDESSFITFIQALADDFEEERDLETEQLSAAYSKGALGWENRTIDTMLGAAAAWGRAGANSPENKPGEQNPWNRCAQILYAGKHNK
jgi:predicted ATPase